VVPVRRLPDSSALNMSNNTVAHRLYASLYEDELYVEGYQRFGYILIASLYRIVFMSSSLPVWHARLELSCLNRHCTCGTADCCSIQRRIPCGAKQSTPLCNAEHYDTGSLAVSCGGVFRTMTCSYYDCNSVHQMACWNATNAQVELWSPKAAEHASHAADTTADAQTATVDCPCNRSLKETVRTLPPEWHRDGARLT
jgi:hypothetical protein